MDLHAIHDAVFNGFSLERFFFFFFPVVLCSGGIPFNNTFHCIVRD